MVAKIISIANVQLGANTVERGVSALQQDVGMCKWFSMQCHESVLDINIL